MNALYLKDLALKTHRRLDRRVHEGRSTGGLNHGHALAPEHATDSTVIRSARRIVEAKAAMVRRIFAEFASMRATAASATTG